MSDPVPQQQGWGCTALALFVIGLLILVPSGLCTGVFGIGILLDSTRLDETLPSLIMVLFVGGPAIVVGGLLVWAGWRMRKLGKR